MQEHLGAERVGETWVISCKRFSSTSVLCEVRFRRDSGADASMDPRGRYCGRVMSIQACGSEAG